MSEFNPVISQEEFGGMGILDEKPQVKPGTARVYLGSGEQCVVFTTGSNITRSELMAGQYSNVYVIDLREFQKTFDQPLGSSDDLAGFAARITLSVRVTQPGIFARSMVKDVSRLVQQKLLPYLENISMNYAPDKSQDLQRECLALLSGTNFRQSVEKDYGFCVNIESILVRPDANALELIQQTRRHEEEHIQAVKKLEEDFALQMARQKKEAEIKLAEMEHRFEIRSREAALKLKNTETGQESLSMQQTGEPGEEPGGDIPAQPHGFEWEDAK